MPNGTISVLGSREKGQEVILEDDVAKMPDRTCFAGSVATTDRLVRTMRFIAEIPLADSVKMVTENPAKIMGFGDTKGRLQRGYDADIVICDRDLFAKQTFVMGRRVF